MKKIATIIAVAALSVGGFAAAGLADNGPPGNSNAGDKVTICHATGSATNPYVQISPNANGVINGHVGHQDGRDIIPPFDYNDHGVLKHFPGQNWDAQGQAIFNNGCKVPAPQPPPTTVTQPTPPPPPPPVTTVTQPGTTVTVPSPPPPPVTVTTGTPPPPVTGTTPKPPPPPATVPPVKKPKVKPHLPKPPKHAKKKPHNFPFTP